MSRTLSKILVICALVVVLPLMIVGTAFAAYYSINATVSIEIYVDQTVDGGRAEVSYKNQTGRIDKKLEVTDGHLKKVTFKTSSVGYDFVGWYAGTYKAFAEELENGKEIDEIKYAVGAQDAKVEMTDYQNLVAVFTAKHYEVKYSYIKDPSDEHGINVEDAPASDDVILVNRSEETKGQTEFVYGEKLPTIELKGKPEWTFEGWYLDGDTTQTRYTTATFTETDNIVLTGKWVDSKHITIEYQDENGNKLTQTANEKPVVTDAYAGHEFDLEDPMAMFEASYYEKGYAYTWKDVATGNSLLGKTSSDTDLVLKISKSEVVYTAKLVYDDEELTLANDVKSELTFDINNKNTLDVWMNEEKWTAKYSFWHFDYLTYDGAKVTDFESIIDGVIDDNPHSTTEITINVVKKVDFAEVDLAVTYASEEDWGYTGKVYKEKDLLNPDESLSETDFSKTLCKAFGFVKDGQLSSFYSDAEEQNAVSLVGVLINDENLFLIDETTTINDLIEYVYGNFDDVSSFVKEGVFTITLCVCFK